MAERKEFPENCIVTAILPTTLDTNQNRKDMPTKDKSKWENTDKIATILKMYGVGESRPENGAFVEFETLKGGIMMPKYA
jgi:hypothetical protein